MSILQTRKGDVWLSTNSGGIARIMASGNYLSEHLSFDNMTKAQGLGSEIAYSLVEDKSGHIWVVSPGNLTRVNPQDGTAVVYDNDHFISEPVFAETLPLVVGEHILFGVADGLIRLNLSKLQKDDYCPPLSLTDCFINNEPGFVRLWQDDRLLLNRKERNLRLHYAAIDYSEKDITWKASIEIGLKPAIIPCLTPICRRENMCFICALPIVTAFGWTTSCNCLFM